MTSHHDETSIALTGSQCFARLNSSFDKHAAAMGFAEFYQECFPIQSRLVLAYVLDAFASLGCELQSLGAGDDVPLIRHHTRHKRLLPQLYSIVEEAGLIAHEGRGQFRRTAVPVPRVSAEVLHNEILTRYPQHAHETKLLRVTASRLADCLDGSVEALSLIFQNSTARSLLEDVYTDAPMFKTATLLLEQYLGDVISHLGNVGRGIRILEMGAGLGGTTKRLVEALSGRGVDFSYTFSDLSSSLVAAARRNFSTLPFMVCLGSWISRRRPRRSCKAHSTSSSRPTASTRRVTWSTRRPTSASC